MGASAYPTLGFDPCPGDPGGVTTLAGQWQDAAFLLSEIAIGLDGTDPVQDRWKGEAADALRTRLDAHRVVIGKFRACCESNTELLKRWRGELQEFQAEAARLEARAAGVVDAQKRRVASPTMGLVADPISGTPAGPDESDGLALMRAHLSGIRGQAEELHARYLDAARLLARQVSALLVLPSGTTGWFGQDIDTAEENRLLLQESQRASGVVPVDPALRTVWWNALTPDEQKAVADAFATGPATVDSTYGLPATVADRLNRQRLKADVQKPGCPQRLKDLWNRLSMRSSKNYQADAYLLGYDDVGNGHVVVSYGDPDTAPNTAVYVPGTGSKLGKAQADLDRAQALYGTANEGQPGSTASIYWLGYDAPGWSLPGPSSPAFADAGAPRLAGFVGSLAANHQGASHVTVIGHSYGTTLVGAACAQAGMKPDDVIFVGSPGVTVDKASQLGLGPGHVWASKAKFDPVPELSGSQDPLEWSDDHSDWFGNDPTSSAFGGRTFDAGEGSWVGHAHSEYWDAGPSLDNMTRIVTGRPDEVTSMPTEDKVGAIPSIVGAPTPYAAPSVGGAALQNLGHHVGGYWGRPIEDAGDSLHDFGQAQNNALTAGGDLLTGDVDGSLNDVKDLGSDLEDSGKNAVDVVTDLFD